MKYTGPDWEYIGIPGFSAGESFSNAIAFGPDDVPYVAYQDWGNGGNATVMKYDFTTGAGATPVPVIALFPNPATDIVHVCPVQNTNSYCIRILDNLGRTTKTFTVKDHSEQELYIGDLERGIYFILIETDGSRMVHKLIKL
jgi:hypothetical protein